MYFLCIFVFVRHKSFVNIPRFEQKSDFSPGQSHLRSDQLSELDHQGDGDNSVIGKVIVVLEEFS